MDEISEKQQKVKELSNVPQICRGSDREAEGGLDQERQEKILYYDCLTLIPHSEN